MAVEKWKLAADAKALVKLQFENKAGRTNGNELFCGMKVIELEDNIEI